LINLQATASLKQYLLKGQQQVAKLCFECHTRQMPHSALQQHLYHQTTLVCVLVAGCCRVTAQGSTPYALALWKGMPANCALAVALNQRADVRTVIHPDSLQRTAAMWRKGPRSLRFIAAEVAKQHLLHQLSALSAQHMQQKRVLQQQAVLLQQHRRSSSYKRLHAAHHAEHAQSPLHRTTSSSKRLAVSSRGSTQPASTSRPQPSATAVVADQAASDEA
jgi:hypothetical protein